MIEKGRGGVGIPADLLGKICEGEAMESLEMAAEILNFEKIPLSTLRILSLPPHRPFLVFNIPSHNSHFSP